ncbi:hypothetical protein K438DRAFT_1928071 [Mycena galopus ATCC 62051]|nr:hypothetical protein K438DRAFT_1928071 [Mycena galopus ATCC 62051]
MSEDLRSLPFSLAVHAKSHTNLDRNKRSQCTEKPELRQNASRKQQPPSRAERLPCVGTWNHMDVWRPRETAESRWQLGICSWLKLGPGTCWPGNTSLNKRGLLVRSVDTAFAMRLIQSSLASNFPVKPISVKSHVLQHQDLPSSADFYGLLRGLALSSRILVSKLTSKPRSTGCSGV